MSTYPVRQPYVSDTPVQLLARPVGALLSVSAPAATLLADLGIKSIFDLGASLLFGTARTITAAAAGVQAVATLPVARDVIDAAVADLTVAQLAEQPVRVLRSVNDTLAQALAATLGIETVRELAAWPPYDCARTIVNAAYGLTPDIQDDPERPAELVPVARHYATERVQYDVLVLDHVLDPEPESDYPRVENRTHLERDVQDLSGRRNPLDVRNAGGIDLADIVGATLMAQPAIGAILTYRQSWFPQGLALGQLLHSLALAPGESTRIALVDWTRRVRASTDEATAQIEALTASLARHRAISEVTSAVAHEAQSGFSELNSTATADQSAATGGSAQLSIDLKDFPNQMDALLRGGELGSLTASSKGTSAAHSTNTGWASSKSASTGDRTLQAQMLQNVADRTQQAANSARNRRATAVMESSQAESEKLSTRVVTNYNHMHALTVLYFEVVQVYRVVLELARATAALFLPLKLITFNENVVRRYRSVIAAAGLTAEVRTLALTRTNQLAIAAPRRTGGWNPRFLSELKQTLGSPVANQNDSLAYLPLQELKLIQVGSSDQDFYDHFAGVAVTLTNGTRYTVPLADRFEAHNGWSGQFGASLPQADAREIARIDLIQKQADFEGSIELLLTFNGKLANGQPWSSVLDIPGGMALGVTIQCRKERVTPAFVLAPAVGSNELLDHLEENALHYSAAIWRSLDAATITTLLATYTLGTSRLIEAIDPVPVAVSGNYLVFRFYGNLDSQAWKALLEKLGMAATPREDTVPLPSGGVFAEAVLGRSNSAEKLDLTRFWNWQDAPIQILPPEINPLTAGGKANDLTPQTGKLEAPVVNIVNSPALPDPAGLGPLYSAVANGNMFRDMSGLTQTAALVNAALQAAQAGAANATGAASEAQKVAAQQLTEVLKLAAQAALGVPSGGGGALGSAAKAGIANTPSNAGALLNYAEKAGPGAAGVGAKPGSGSTSGSGAVGASQPAAPPAINDFQKWAFQSALGRPMDPAYLLTGGPAPAPKTGVSGANPPSAPHSSLPPAAADAVGWISSFVQEIGRSERDKLGDAMVDAAVDVAKAEILDAGTQALDRIPYVKVLKTATRYSLAFAEGAGIALKERQAEIQQIVDAAADFQTGDGLSPADIDKQSRARKHLAIGVTKINGIVVAGLESAVEVALQDLFDGVSARVGRVLKDALGKVAKRIASALLLQSALEAAVQRVGQDVPALRFEVYCAIQKPLFASWMKTLAGQSSTSKFSAVAAATGYTETPDAALLAGLIQLGARGALASLVQYAGHDTTVLELQLEKALRGAQCTLARRLVQAGWKIVSSPAYVEPQVDEAGKRLGVPGAHWFLEDPDPPSDTEWNEIIGFLDVDQEAFRTMLAALDGALEISGAVYQHQAAASTPERRAEALASATRQANEDAIMASTLALGLKNAYVLHYRTAGLSVQNQFIPRAFAAVPIRLDDGPGLVA